MAFKPVTLDDCTSCVSPYDPAIDTDASDMTAYAEQCLKHPGAWREHIKARDGQTIMEFVVGVIPAAEMARINDESDGPALRSELAQWRSFCWALRDIKGWPDNVPKIKRGQVEYVDPAWIERTFVRGLRKVGLNIGVVAWMFNQMTEEEIKN